MAGWHMYEYISMYMALDNDYSLNKDYPIRDVIII
jgi:hypothetical protein